METPRMPVVPLNEAAALAQIANALAELTKEVREIKGYLHGITNQLIRGGPPPR